MKTGSRPRSRMPMWSAVVLVSALAMPAFAAEPKPQTGEPPGTAKPPRHADESSKTPSPRLRPRGHGEKPGAPPQADAMPGPGKPGAAKAQPTPDSPADRAKMLSDLYAHLATADSEGQSKPVVDAIERLWLYSGSDTITLLMERSLHAVAAKRPDLAMKLLDAVTVLAPDFAEGWNRRAYVYYTQNDYERALGDLRRVLALEPNHFKALDGLAQIFKETGNKKAALKAYKELMQVYPHSPGVDESVRELSREVEGQGI